MPQNTLPSGIHDLITLATQMLGGRATHGPWLGTGCTHRGTNVSKRIGARIAVGRGVIAYLKQHPQYEVPFAQVTAADGQVIFDEMTAAAKELRAVTSETAPCKRQRDAAEKTLRREMRATRILLSVTLKKTDPRWRSFGLHLPPYGVPSQPRPRRRRKGTRSELPPVELVDATVETAEPVAA